MDVQPAPSAMGGGRTRIERKGSIAIRERTVEIALLAKGDGPVDEGSGKSWGKPDRPVEIGNRALGIALPAVNSTTTVVRFGERRIDIDSVAKVRNGAFELVFFDPGNRTIT